ncbi:hypothetical protein B0H13DRAFT_1898473 [Mycena leptocephala]|nr:hypothetical protein B0H13DRAFT_1898473 [Mycena leptocephala]
MSSKSITQNRLNNLTTSLTVSVSSLNEITQAFGTPFIEVISNTTLALTNMVQKVNKNQYECVSSLEKIQELICTIIDLHIKSKTTKELPLSAWNHIGEFTETLQKFYLFVEAQQKSNKFKHFFRQNEMNARLQDCNLRLQHALDNLKVDLSVVTWTDVREMSRMMQAQHTELLEAITALTDDTISERSSLVLDYSLATTNFKEYQNNNSTNSLSILPAKPKIFYGRDRESPRIAILGAGGMGKTSLAKAALHHPSVTAKYQCCFFVASDSAFTGNELTALIGLQLGLKPSKNLTNLIVSQLSSYNLETSWEPKSSRTEVEELLSTLTDIPHLALMITMRGAERPAKVSWTHPFLPPLNPLTNAAARQTFFDIADDFHASTDIDALLDLTDNMPLAVNLIAYLVDSNDCASVLSRWNEKKTILLSDGHDRQSNLDISISLSLSSPRITDVPGARNLLSILSILPDGLSDTELVQMKFPIPDVLKSKAALLRTSLAYLDDKRVKVLVPIREYIQHALPPSQSLVQLLSDHFQKLIQFESKFHGRKGDNLTPNLKNIQNILLLSLQPDNPKFTEIFLCTLSFNSLSRIKGHGSTLLIDHLAKVHTNNPTLELKFLSEVLASWRTNQLSDAEAVNIIEQIHKYLSDIDNPEYNFVKCHLIIGDYYLIRKNDIQAAIISFETALSWANTSGDTLLQCQAVISIASANMRLGQYTSAQKYSCQAQKFANDSADLFQEAHALWIEAGSCVALGNYNRAIALCERGCDLLRLCSRTGGDVFKALQEMIAEVHLAKSEYVDALHIRTDHLQQYSPDKGAIRYACALLNASIVEIEIDMSQESHVLKQNLDKARAISAQNGYSTGVLWCDAVAAELHRREGNILEAKITLENCLTEARGRDAGLTGYCLLRLGNASLWGPCGKESSSWTIIALAYSLGSKSKLEIFKVLHHLGDIFLVHGDKKTAHSLFTVALEGFTEMDVHCGRAECMLHLGNIARQDGDLSKAVELWRTAQPLFQQSSQSKQITHIDELLTGISHELNDALEEEHLKAHLPDTPMVPPVYLVKASREEWIPVEI